MSGNNTKTNERNIRENKVSEKVFYIPREGYEGKAVNAVWQDDVEEMAKDIDEEIGYETFEDEASYESPSDEKVVDLSKFEDEQKFSEIIKRAKAQKIGARVLGLYRKAA